MFQQQKDASTKVQPANTANTVKPTKTSPFSGLPTRVSSLPKIATNKQLPPHPNTDTTVPRVPLRRLSVNVNSLHQRALLHTAAMKDQQITLTRSRATLITTTAPKNNMSKITVEASGSPARVVQSSDPKSSSINFSRPTNSPNGGKIAPTPQSTPKILQASPLSTEVSNKSSPSMDDFVFVEQSPISQPSNSHATHPDTSTSSPSECRPGYRMKRLSAVPRSSILGPRLYISDEADLFLGSGVHDKHPDSMKRSASADSVTGNHRHSSMKSLLLPTKNHEADAPKWPIDTESASYRTDHQRYLLKKSLEPGKASCPVPLPLEHTKTSLVSSPAPPRFDWPIKPFDNPSTPTEPSPAVPNEQRSFARVELGTGSILSVESAPPPSNYGNNEAADNAMKAMAKTGLIQQNSVTDRSRSKSRLATNIRDFISRPSKPRSIEKPTVGPRKISPRPRSSSPAIRMRSHRCSGGTVAPPIPEPQRLKELTAMAMSMLEDATQEPSPPRKEKLVSVSKLLIDAITSARDVHKAMREAQQAATEAEIYYEMTELSVVELNKLAMQIYQDEKIRA